MAKKATSRKLTTKSNQTHVHASKPTAKPAAKPAAKTATKTAAKRTAKPASKPAAHSAPAAESHEEPAGTVVMDRRSKGERRKETDRRQNDTSVAMERRQSERRKVPRRRQIDPTTCERDYSGDEVEFMSALDQYKRTSGRMFPTCSEILEVVRSLGYEKRQPMAPLAQEVGESQEMAPPVLALVMDSPSIEVPADLRAELEPQL